MEFLSAANAESRRLPACSSLASSLTGAPTTVPSRLNCALPAGTPTPVVAVRDTAALNVTHSPTWVVGPHHRSPRSSRAVQNASGTKVSFGKTEIPGHHYIEDAVATRTTRGLLRCSRLRPVKEFRSSDTGCRMTRDFEFPMLQAPGQISETVKSFAA
jgi:hypothetical protein